MEAIMEMWWGMDSMNERISSIGDRIRMVNMDGHLKSSNATHQNNVQETSSGHAQETSTTISPRTPHHMFYPLQGNVPLPTTTILNFIKCSLMTKI